MDTRAQMTAEGKTFVAWSREPGAENMVKYELVKRGDAGFVIAKPDGVVPVIQSREVDDVREKGARVTLKGGGSVDATGFFRSVELARYALERELNNSLAGFEHARDLVATHLEMLLASPGTTIVDGNVYEAPAPIVEQLAGNEKAESNLASWEASLPAPEPEASLPAPEPATQDAPPPKISKRAAKRLRSVAA